MSDAGTCNLCYERTPQSTILTPLVRLLDPPIECAAERPSLNCSGFTKQGQRQMHRSAPMRCMGTYGSPRIRALLARSHYGSAASGAPAGLPKQ